MPDNTVTVILAWVFFCAMPAYIVFQVWVNERRLRRAKREILMGEPTVRVELPAADAAFLAALLGRHGHNFHFGSPAARQCFRVIKALEAALAAAPAPAVAGANPGPGSGV